LVPAVQVKGVFPIIGISNPCEQLPVFKHPSLKKKKKKKRKLVSCRPDFLIKNHFENISLEIIMGKVQ